MSDLIDIGDTVETVEGVLVKVMGDHSGDSTGVTTVVEGGTCNGGERAAEGRDGDEGVADAGTETDMNAIGIREGDKDDG